ncbi:MAG: hypothetical protein J0M24_28095 [Verrucomicrobia bacterium]|nr:hypothetical protein [Verrucomicrobiota bacterium]
MTKISNLARLGFAGFAVLSGNLVLATNITITDPFADSSTFTTPYTNPSGVKEAGTVENGASTGNSWDLASFDLVGKSLSVNGGFNFQTGIGAGNSSVFAMGDIFVYANTPYNSTTPYVGKDDWSYVIHFDRLQAAAPGNRNPNIQGNSLKYQIIPKGSEAGYIYTQNPSALIIDLPWMVGNPVTPAWEVGDYSFSGTSLGNDFKNSISLDIADIPAGEWYFSTTMRCGNDVMWGHARLPDGGLTLGMLGVSLLGLSYARRKIA